MHSGILNRLASTFVGAMAWMLRVCRRQQVDEISTEGIRDLLDKAAGDEFLLVDVRSEAETAVSMIPGSITRADFESSQDDYRGRTVVAYCTIGGRSLLFAQRLVSRGFTCLNYRDGILGWCETGQPLVRPTGEDTKEVHTHNRFFRVPDSYEQRS